ncbi:MAG: hypothetical protein ACX932_06510 [Gammaproteobacteria bacterium]
MKWIIWIVCFFSVSAFAANSDVQQRQQQLSRTKQLNYANNYAETVISTMEGLLQGYDASTLSSAFSQEITNLTNYANGIGHSHRSGINGDSGTPAASVENVQTPTVTQPKAAPQIVPPSGSFDITPSPKDNDVSSVPNITGF